MSENEQMCNGHVTSKDIQDLAHAIRFSGMMIAAAIRENRDAVLATEQRLSFYARDFEMVAKAVRCATARLPIGSEDVAP